MGYGKKNISIMYTNPLGCIYLKGDKVTEGSLRFCIDPDNGNVIIEKLIGTWESIAELVGVESNISIFFDNFNARLLGITISHLNHSSKRIRSLPSRPSKVIVRPPKTSACKFPPSD